ncbi:peptidoglycan recognition family protein [Kitasatospora sp. A2-31]|uniref:peptidoglycan recognition protein family protein n=1 Tax=Kitasatospora sp. A2-31 TaxID=2916414 RepID=UPI001EED669F|nr:peptidoglycan recognition family protein [Kitasatospora sp. A2-31]MCG6499473.1 peptidoglycan recognition protein family protein [Kitasatospora sp. A2-31]
MAWYPGAEKMELQPESDTQPAIVPTQVIFHSIAAPWTPRRIYEYWRDSTNLDCHFGVGYDGAVGQFIGTQTRADANFRANRRPDGTGAVSIETASNDQHTDPWTDAQLAALIQLGAWLHRQHGIPLRVCRSADDPGFGYHRLFPDWSDGGTACPGDARVQQFRTVVLPGIIAAVNGQTTPAPTPAPTPMEDDMPLTNADVDRVAQRVVYLLAQANAGEPPAGADENLRWLIDWYHQCSQSSMGAVLDYKVGSTLKASAEGAVRDALAGGMQFNLIPKGA